MAPNLVTESDLEEASHWFLIGTREAIEVILKRIASEFLFKKTGFSLSAVEFSDGRPALTLNAHGARTRQIGMFAIEELVGIRHQLRVPPLRQNPLIRESNNAEFFVAYLNRALAELRRLGFVASGLEPNPLSDSDDDVPFSEYEQAAIRARLESLEATLIAQYELSLDQAEFIKSELAGLREEVSKLSRWTWRHLARSVLSGIASMIGSQGGELALNQALDLLRPFFGRFLRLVGRL